MIVGNHGFSFLTLDEAEPEVGRYRFDTLDTSGVRYPWFGAVRADRDVFWTFDTGDYKLANPDFPTSWVDLLAHLEQVEPTQGGSLVHGDSEEIVLLHDHPHTNALQPGYYRDLIRAMQARGVEFVAPRVTAAESGR